MGFLLEQNLFKFFDGTALYICTSGSIVSEGRFAIEIYKCRLAEKLTNG
jgi:hypothetical protein